MSEDGTPTRAGIVGIAGRPNVGKSTLVNAIVGSKVSIVSDKPQTTRHAARGVLTDAASGRQLILTDLPGVQRPRDELTRRMQSRVEREVVDADAILLVVNGEEGIGPGDRFIAERLVGETDRPVLCAVNKRDRMGEPATVEALSAAAELAGVDEVFPVSARTGAGVAELVDRLSDLMPEGPFLYPPDSTGPEEDSGERRLAELIREQVLKRTRQEVPHAVEVRILDVSEREDGLVEIVAEAWAETEGQKAILIGAGGKMVREVGAAARKQLERELEARVYLDLQVRVRPGWRRDEGLLDRLGIE